MRQLKLECNLPITELGLADGVRPGWDPIPSVSHALEAHALVCHHPMSNSLLGQAQTVASNSVCTTSERKNNKTCRELEREMGRSRSRSRDRYRERSRDRGGGGGSYRDRSPPRRGGGGGGGGRDRDEACSLLVRNLSDRVEGRGMKYA
jgi:hypothetical protein